MHDVLFSSRVLCLELTFLFLLTILFLFIINIKIYCVIKTSSNPP
jgi:hypothetical protein